MASSRRATLKSFIFIALGTVVVGRLATAAVPEWSMNGTVLEACSCPAFCPCYFNPHPAEHAGHKSFCRFNMAHKIISGHYGDVKLDGAKFWVAGDLGGDFTKVPPDALWGQLHFDPSVTKEQRDGLQVILKKLYQYRWKRWGVGKDGTVDWDFNEDKAVAKLDGGKGAEIVLKRNGTALDPKASTKISNLVYESAKRNDGFLIMPNEIEAYRIGAKKFEFKGTNGFVVTYDIASKDFDAVK